MTASARTGAAGVRAALARARDAGARLARRPLPARLDALAAWLDTLADPASRVRRALEAELPAATGFSPEVVREGLAAGLAPFTGDALRAVVDRELGGNADAGAGGGRRATGFPVTAQILAGAVPPATLPSLLAPLVLGSAVVAKPPVHDPVTAPRLAGALADVDPELGACVAIAAFRSGDADALDALLEADCVVATGSDETVARVAARVGPPRRLVAYGHRLSLAVLGPDALGDDARRADVLARVAFDVALWDQQGCLSPLALYVVTGDAPVPERLLDDAAAALAQAEARWPRGRLAPDLLGAARHARDTAELRAAGGEGVAVRVDPQARWTLVAEPDAAFRGTPPARFLRVHPVADVEALAAALAPVGPHLAAVAVDGFDDPARRSVLHALLARAGASRICSPGTLQAPPLAWSHDNRPLLLPLARLTDVEP